MTSCFFKLKNLFRQLRLHRPLDADVNYFGFIVQGTLDNDVISVTLDGPQPRRSFAARTMEAIKTMWDFLQNIFRRFVCL